MLNMDNGGGEQGCLIAATVFDGVQLRQQDDSSKDTPPTLGNLESGLKSTM
jgi:hypothetical protein